MLTEDGWQHSGPDRGWGEREVSKGSAEPDFAFQGGKSMGLLPLERKAITLRGLWSRPEIWHVSLIQRFFSAVVPIMIWPILWLSFVALLFLLFGLSAMMESRQRKKAAAASKGTAASGGEDGDIPPIPDSTFDDAIAYVSLTSEEKS